MDRALEGEDGDARGLCAVAGGRRRAFPEIPPEAFRARVPARAARRPRARGRRGRPRARSPRRRAAARSPRRTGASRVRGRSRSSRTGSSRAIGRAATRRRRACSGALGREARRTSPRARSSCALLGLCYLAAFVSLWVQVDGLVGARGILPVGQFLDWVRAQTGAERYWLLPTLCWLSSSDAFLHLLCGAGVARGAAARGLGWRPAAALPLCWVSLPLARGRGPGVPRSSSGTACCSRRACSRSSSRRRGAGASARGLAAVAASSLLLLRWLLFRLMFSSGWVKLASGDPTWRNLTALRYHYETQPLPPWTAWFVHQLPAVVPDVLVRSCCSSSSSSCRSSIFAPRRLRLFAFRRRSLLQLAHRRDRQLRLLQPARRSRSRVLLVDDAVAPAALEASAAETRRRPPGAAWPRPILASGRRRVVLRRLVVAVRRDARPRARAAAARSSRPCARVGAVPQRQHATASSR